MQDIKLAHVLQILRDRLNAMLGRAFTPDTIWIDITGPVRCKKHNAEIPGAAPNSYHIKGIACDFKIRVGKAQVLDPKIAFVLLDAWHPDEFGMGLYYNRVHLDTRDYKARWFLG
jgi:uncharacterized protein YcbK (DUF882 family)